VYYGGRCLTLEVEFGRGSPKSIFQDRLDGGWTIRIRGGLDERERAFLNRGYGHLAPAERDTVVKRLTEIMSSALAGN
jgi:hypothetical protein